MSGRTESERREQALLGVITYAEFAKHVPANPYIVRYGGHLFMDMSRHPGSFLAWHHRSSAAGAFMINEPTYEDALKKGAVHNFDMDSQTAIALDLIRHEGALPTSGRVTSRPRSVS